MTQKHLPAKRLFEVLMFMFVYVALTVAWFGFAAPEMVSSPFTSAILVGRAGSVLWLICPPRIAVHIINKWN
ncbi:hypothetical protein [Pseudomonas citrulli]|uniref:DUF2798 domain-containing protein n=1 Tax=Pseudomonas citrulli TaxID=3064347 RepID=A0ABT9BY03_9PSED|nr:hypothetical protein [Pseudomonas sp. K18]MDO7897086.1 hypothetical protein [Pseudomonas sp. K18]